MIPDAFTVARTFWMRLPVRFRQPRPPDERPTGSQGTGPLPEFSAPHELPSAITELWTVVPDTPSSVRMTVAPVESIVDCGVFGALSATMMFLSEIIPMMSAHTIGRGIGLIGELAEHRDVAARVQRDFAAQLSTHADAAVDVDDALITGIQLHRQREEIRARLRPNSGIDHDTHGAGKCDPVAFGIVRRERGVEPRLRTNACIMYQVRSCERPASAGDRRRDSISTSVRP